jgi:uncharacterized membrane protein YccC
VTLPIATALLGYARRLRFPVLLGITAALFLVNLVVPDPLPLVDELLLGLGTLLFASLRNKSTARRDAPDRQP